MVPGDEMELGIQFQVEGTLRSGEEEQTNVATFPIRVTRQGCPTGQVPSNAVPCGNYGQDGVVCCDPANTTCMDP
jgi:hypothetical protein